MNLLTIGSKSTSELPLVRSDSGRSTLSDLCALSERGNGRFYITSAWPYQTHCLRRLITGLGHKWGIEAISDVLGHCREAETPHYMRSVYTLVPQALLPHFESKLQFETRASSECVCKLQANDCAWRSGAGDDNP